jgi:predicted RNase H-like HicB family nuclease
MIFTKFQGFFDTVFRGLNLGPIIMPKKIELLVHLAFDEEAKVWFVAQSDIPGLSLEANTPHELMARIEGCAHEMVELNISEIIETAFANKVARQRLRSNSFTPVTKRPPVSVRPVFDSSFDLACA